MAVRPARRSVTTAISRIRSGSRPRWLVPAAVVVGVVVLAGLLLAAPYNGLVSKEATADRTFADLDVQLQRRNDLIPTLSTPCAAP